MIWFVKWYASILSSFRIIHHWISCTSLFRSNNSYFNFNLQYLCIGPSFWNMKMRANGVYTVQVWPFWLGLGGWWPLVSRRNEQWCLLQCWRAAFMCLLDDPSTGQFLRTTNCIVYYLSSFWFRISTFILEVNDLGTGQLLLVATTTAV